jgi:hypothetical protein
MASEGLIAGFPSSLGGMNRSPNRASVSPAVEMKPRTL